MLEDVTMATAVPRRVQLLRLGLRRLAAGWTLNGRKVSIADSAINGLSANNWAARVTLWRRHHLWKE
jgi:hypothetical protein